MITKVIPDYLESNTQIIMKLMVHITFSGKKNRHGGFEREDYSN